MILSILIICSVDYVLIFIFEDKIDVGPSWGLKDATETKSTHPPSNFAFLLRNILKASPFNLLWVNFYFKYMYEKGDMCI